VSGLFTAETIAAVTGVQPATLRKWVERGHVVKHGRDRYDGESVIAHWRATTLAEPVRDTTGRFTGRAEPVQG
jgi:phage terminase Nu1 subunit (DNA packaging protein)